MRAEVDLKPLLWQVLEAPQRLEDLTELLRVAGHGIDHEPLLERRLLDACGVELQPARHGHGLFSSL